MNDLTVSPKIIPTVILTVILPFTPTVILTVSLTVSLKVSLTTPRLKIRRLSYLAGYDYAAWGRPHYRAGCLWLLLITHTRVGNIFSARLLRSDASGRQSKSSP